jgi:pimeloyl-ACP methyl ester carboxylesterase
MNAPRSSRLEIISRLPQRAAHQTPLLFVHGAFAAAWCWDEHFLGFFADAGYAAHAVSLSGHGRSRGREHLDSLCIEDYLNDVVETMQGLPALPVLIGHSMGGFVVQKVMERHAVAAAALLCSVPPQGLMAAAFGMMFSHPALMSDLNRLMGGGEVALDTLREALFAQPVDAAALARYYRWSQPESHRAIWDMSLFNLPHPSRIAARIDASALLVLGAELDHLIPASLVEMTARTYGVAATIFPGMGHGLMLERDWVKPAQHLLDWLKGRNLP